MEKDFIQEPFQQGKRDPQGGIGLRCQCCKDSWVFTTKKQSGCGIGRWQIARTLRVRDSYETDQTRFLLSADQSDQMSRVGMRNLIGDGG